jgi:glutathione S-transferase
MMPIESQSMRVHRHYLSGHCHRVELFLSLLGLPAELVNVDLSKGEQRKPEFLAFNPLGQVPVLEDGAVRIADSNAILVYLASKYGDESWLPRAPEDAAAVQRFLSLAAGEIAQGPARARVAKVFGVPLDIDAAHTTAARLFKMLEQHLAKRAWLVGQGRTVADIACYSYIAHAPEGGVSLEPYPHIRAWLGRVEALPGFTPMQATPLAA